MKSDLRAAIDAAGPDGRYNDDVLDRIHALMQALAADTPMPRPIDAQQQVAGPWLSRFAQFGPKHTAGKPIAHDTSARLLSFGTFPDCPIRLLAIEQEIHHETMAYNNVQRIAPVAGGAEAHLIVFGRYHIEPDAPKRYVVDFDRVALVAPDGRNDATLRADFGLPPDTPLDVTMKPPKLHSDVVFCDQDIRINFGSMGGAYVMDRLDHAGHSVRFR